MNATETKATHTPGPWQVMNSPKSGCLDIWSLGSDEPQERKVIAEIEPSDTKWADAALIAAAPDLLAALQFAAKYHLMQRQSGKDGFPPQLETAINLAIGKAT